MVTQHGDDCEIPSHHRIHKYGNHLTHISIHLVTSSQNLC